MSLTIYVLNDPNLNLPGTRKAPFQTGSRDRAQQARQKAADVVAAAGGYMHTSVAIHDALKTLTMPAVGVHSATPETGKNSGAHGASPTAAGANAGFGAYGYRLAPEATVHLADQRSK